MSDKIPFTQRTGVRNFELVIGASLAIFLLFFNNFFAVTKIIFSFFLLVIKYNFLLFVSEKRELLRVEIASQLPSNFSESMAIFIIIIMSGILVHWITLFFISQFILPVKNWDERILAYNRIIRYSFGRHGPAVFVRGGTLIERNNETDNSKPGVILVDLSSAVALFKQPKAKSRFFSKEQEDSDDTVEVIWMREEKGFNGKASAVFGEAKGPGIVFTQKGQKVFSALDLRKQTRTSDEIEAYTRNGIRVKSKVNVTFSLSDEPEKIVAGFVGTARENKLMGLITSIDEQRKILTINDTYELDEEDAVEILNYIKAEIPFAPKDIGSLMNTSPYKFNRDRILAAAFSQARNVEGELMPWDDVPIETATDIFRKMLSSIPYDNLFSGVNMETPSSSPKASEKEDTTISFVKRLKDDFSRRVKMKGLLCFELYMRNDETPFTKGQAINLDVVNISPIIQFSSNKFNSFRKRGISVLSAGFGEIRPADSKIQKKMVENWKAKLDNEINMINAEYELESIRVKNRNRAQIQHETTYLLSSIFQSIPHFEEALALRVLQAIETAVTDHGKQEITSTELNTMLENLHEWLFTERKDIPLLPPDAQRPKPIHKSDE
jgi:hypothetical protein